MAFDQSTRNRLQKFVNDACNLLTEEFTRQLQATYGLDPKAGSIAAVDSLTQLDNRQRQTANVLRDTLAHYLATTHGKGEKDRTKQALSRIVREQAFTVLNRLTALRMAEARGFLLETIAKGYNAKGFQLYKQLAGSSLGETGEAYRNYLYSVFDEFSLDLAVLFDRHSAQGRLFPRESALLELLDLINHHEIEPLWAEDETIGWIYQYFNSQEERKKMRAESQAPRNSRELAVRNQFFTPRYVVEFLTDNTLGRIWYEMTQGNTGLVESCRYLVRRPTELFLKPGEQAPEHEEAAGKAETLSQEELLKQTIYIPHRAIKDPRCIRMLDPACGSMHFGLYAFDLYERIYEEAWQLEAELGAEAFIREDYLKPLHQTYDSFENYKSEVPRLIIEHNIHGVDIDPRAVQIAGLSLWQRAQRAWQQQGIKPQQRPVVRKSNIVCAEPMPGEKAMLQEFSNSLNPPVLGQLIEAIFDKMELAGEAGTLLKIEEEIQTSIHEARDQWQARSGSHLVGDMFQAELDQATPQKELGFDLSGVDDESFWDGAEQLILDALSNYADKAASNADQKRLFADDAAKGFAFIDLCRNRFEVVLMNPPFGEASKKSQEYIDRVYKESKTDLFGAMVERGLQLLNDEGKVSAITNRVGFFNTQFESWRDLVLMKSGRLAALADLGYGVLDAMVETAAYIITRTDKSQRAAVFGLLKQKEKDTSLEEAIQKFSKSVGNQSTYYIDVDVFSLLEGHPLCYWVSEKTLRKLAGHPKFEGQGRTAKQGLATADDYRFVYAAWEVPTQEIGDKWFYFAKGGEYSPYWDDIHLVINWKTDGKEAKAFAGTLYNNSHWTRILKNVQYYFRSGITYPERTTSDFAPRIFPEGNIFSATGQAIFFDSSLEAEAYLGILNSRPYRLLFELFIGSGDAVVSGSAARHYKSGVINSSPVPSVSTENQNILSQHVRKCIDNTIQKFSTDETTRYFILPALLKFKNGSLVDSYLNYQASLNKTYLCIIQESWEVENKVNELYKLDEDDMEIVRQEYGIHPMEIQGEQLAISNEELIDLWNLSDDSLVDVVADRCGRTRQVTKKSFYANRKIELLSRYLNLSPQKLVSALNDLRPIDTTAYELAIRSLVSYFVGVLFGRWDIGHATRDIAEEIHVDPLSKLPALSPGMPGKLNDKIKIENVHTGSTEELPVASYLVEDETHTLDIAQNVQKIICVLWGQEAEVVEHEICKVLKIDSLRTYFQRPNLFYSSHFQTYSKSRRKAPIYWPIQLSSGSYTVWLYYHGLNDQSVYKCVNDCVEPKLRSVADEAALLRDIPSRNSQEEQALTRLLDLEEELKDFRDELLRIAKFWKPDLNDGVQITAAPLWKLFQHKAWQKKLKETWESLEKGDYDWAHLACSIWPERVLRKCHQDRSLAIAHDVEDIFWHEVEVPVRRGKKPTGETKQEWQPKELTDEELDALIQAKITEKKA